MNHCTVEAPNPYDKKQGWLKNQNDLLVPIWQVWPIVASALVDIEDSVGHEREHEGLIKLNDFNDCIEEKEEDDLSTD